ncbi:MAG: tripartite tricarboxylate transporter permease [Planctomycetota bacterium]|jgi:putative tricarboxylic transport membrane protein|nr:tripartite tricarboxylate transporter permease [Planctomycetota bacterium]
MSELIGPTLSNLFIPNNFIFMNIGVFLGIVFGAIPGINATLAITVMLPFTFMLDVLPALFTLTGVFFGANFGGSISAILINTPGTNNAAATLLDGYPLARKGYPGKALDMALAASTFGGLVSAFSLLFFSPQVTKVALRFGPPEFFALAIFGLSIIASISGGNILKGLISGGLGILLATVGVDGVSGIPRFTFGSLSLYNGVKMVAVLLGVFAISQMINRIRDREEGGASRLGRTSSDDHLTMKEFKSTIPTMVKSSCLGAIIGAIPGPGAAIASFIAYNEAKRCAKPGERFGEGELKGIAAPESANNGATASTLIPLLTLGIPGDAVAATLLGAFTMHGLVVGPKLFITSGPVIYAMMIGCVIAQFFLFLQGKYLLRVIVKVTSVPPDLLTALLVVVCCAGAFAVANMTLDVYVMLIFGCIAYFMQKLDLPSVPIVLGMVLGPIAEENLRNSLAMSGGEWSIFVTRPICLAIICFTFVLIFMLKKGDAGRARAEREIFARADVKPPSDD